MPLAIVSAALIGVLGGGGAVWLAPMLLAVVVATWLLAGGVQALVRAAGFAVLTGLLWIPVIASGALSPVAQSKGSSAAVVQPLIGFPLSGFQLFGIWPTGDFRLDPNDPAIAYALIAVVAVAALIAIRFALRARSWGLLIYVGSALVSVLTAFLFAPPWIAGKALATASPAIPLAAAAGGAALFAAGLRVAGTILLVALAAGVLWSNALAYHDVNLAPRGELGELQTIGGEIAGEGPTLMTEYNPYGFRHFLRDAAPEGVPGGDTDAFNVFALLKYRTLVLRRSPAQSRPPSPYRLTWRGNYYEVWQRSEGSRGAVVAHLGLGSAVDPAGLPNCSQVRRLAHEAGPSGSLAAVARDPVEVVPLLLTAHPAGWHVTGDLELVPKGAGTVTAQVRLPRGATYEVWLGGSAGARPSTDVSIDGRGVSSMGQLIQSDGDYVQLASARLSAGEHTISLDLHGSNLGPGSGAARAALGPLTLSVQDSADTKISRFPASQAKRLCGRRWDWVEALRK